MNIALTVITVGTVIVLFLAVLYTMHLVAGVQKKLNEITGHPEVEKTAPPRPQTGTKDLPAIKKEGEKDYREVNIVYIQKSDDTGVQITGPSGISFEGKEPTCRLDIVIEK